MKRLTLNEFKKRMLEDEIVELYETRNKTRNLHDRRFIDEEIIKRELVYHELEGKYYKPKHL